MYEEDWFNYFENETERDKWLNSFENAENAALWRDSIPTIDSSLAYIYHNNGILPSIVKNWKDKQFDNDDEIINWNKIGVKDPEFALNLKNIDMDMDYYKRCKDAGIENYDDILYYIGEINLTPEEYGNNIKNLIDNNLLKKEDLIKWKENNFKSDEIKKWLDIGIKNPEEAFLWKEYEFSPFLASRWKKIIKNPATARKWLLNDWDIDSVRSLIRMGYNDPDEVSENLDNLIVKI